MAFKHRFVQGDAHATLSFLTTNLQPTQKMLDRTDQGCDEFQLIVEVETEMDLFHAVHE